ncbi:hypothetical protein [Flavonifractor porci]|uniref:hypothetical protein n=1 Tax=Flavonifractor porci TaxID=3133422 RepID=UPI0030ADF866
MRYIDLSEIDTDDPQVRQWLTKAHRATQNMRQAADHAARCEYLEKHAIWSEFKEILIKYYGHICWYSECALTGSYGDVDHFRPKNKSTKANGECILQDGYWWLAYDYLNYRLSCETCNRPYGEGGKRDIFPLKQGVDPSSPFARNEVDYLLIDPCNYNDTKLVGFDENGSIIALSSDQWERTRVNVSRTVYNWDLFNAARKRVRILCRTALIAFELEYANGSDRMLDTIEGIFCLVDDKTPYASFAKQYIALKIEGKPYEEELKQLLKIQ